MTAPPDDDEMGVRYQPGQDLSVGHGNQWVVIAGEDESRLLEAVEPRQASPPLERPDLVPVPPGRWRPGQTCREVVLGKPERCTAVQLSGS